MLPKGEYLGALYDIGFDKPEAHAISKDGAMYYASMRTTGTAACSCAGSPKAAIAYAICSTNSTWARWTRTATGLELSFKRFVLLQAAPLKANA